MLLGEDDSALKVAQQIKFHGLVGCKAFAYKKIKSVILWIKKIQSHFEEILKIEHYFKKAVSYENNDW